MADVTVSYKGNTIAEMSASGTKTLLTSGKYCEGDITLQYVKSSGAAYAETKMTMSATKVNTSFTVSIPCSFTPVVLGCVCESDMSTSQNVMSMIKNGHVFTCVRGTTTNYYVAGSAYGDLSYSNGVLTVTSSNSNMVFRQNNVYRFFVIG